MAFFWIARAAVADEHVIVLRLHADGIYELINRPAEVSINR